MEEVKEPVIGEENEYPSLSLGYDISLKSYDWAIKRIDSWDGNLDKVLAWASPIALALIGKAIIAVRSQPCHDWSLIVLSILFFVVAVAVAIWGKTGHVQLISPALLLKNWITLEPNDFMYYAIREAGIHLDNNTALVEKKARATALTVAAFILSATFGVMAWVLSAG